MTDNNLTPADLATFDQHWQTVTRSLDRLVSSFCGSTGDGTTQREVDLILFASALTETTQPDQLGALLACAVARIATRLGPDTEIKKLDDGWAWRCWVCGWHGVGLVSGEGARREMAQHECHPAGDRLRTVPAEGGPAAQNDTEVS